MPRWPGRCPQVTTVALPKQPERFVEALFSDGLFDTLTISAEDRQRAELYRRRDAANALRTSARSLEDFYRSLAMTVHLRRLRTPPWRARLK